MTSCPIGGLNRRIATPELSWTDVKLRGLGNDEGEALREIQMEMETCTTTAGVPEQKS